ncbi:MAG: alpha-2-macroglobulin family protein, partial [Planctomycetota bacterium]
MRRGSGVPGLAALTDRLHEEDRLADEMIAALLPAYADAVDAATERAGAASVELAQTRSLLELASVTRFGLAEPARIATKAAWARPAGLALPLELRASPCRPGTLDWTDVRARAQPAWHGTLQPEGPIDLRPLPPGSWLLEARTPGSPWWGLRAVEVSDLDAVALAGDGVLALAAFDANGPVAARWWLGAHAGELAHGEVGAAPALAAFAWPANAAAMGATLQLEGAAGTAWRRSDWRLGPIAHQRERWLAHGMVDRPLYRAGDTVRGRVALRACAWRGAGAAAVPTTHAAAGQDLVVTARFGSSDLRAPTRTDAQGIAEFTFVVPAEVGPDMQFYFAAELPERDEKGDPLQLDLGYLAQTSGQRLRAVQFDLDGPERLAPDATAAAITLRATWTSGGPAAGVDVEVRDDEDARAVHLRTDASGRATVALPVAALGSGWNRLRLRLTGPDGGVEERMHWVRVAAPGDAAEQAQQERDRTQREPLRVELGDAVVGAPCRVTAFGRPHARGLLVAGRAGNARVHAVRFDDAGRAEVAMVVLPVDWPRFDVIVATSTDHASAATPARLRAALAPRIELPATAAPGSDLSCRVHTGAPGALVTIAVVDERVFDVVADRTREPDRTLVPEAPDGGWVPFGARSEESLQQVLASLLENGRLPAWDGRGDLAARGGPAAGGAGGPSAPAAGGVRRTFAATAAFATVVADAAGEAVLPFHLPDDLTRWRATAVVVDADGSGAIA